MRSYRCLLIACVTLSHACDSKGAAAISQGSDSIVDDITFALTVGKDNEILDAAVSGSDIGPGLAECLTKAALAWKVKLAPGKHRIPLAVKVE